MIAVSFCLIDIVSLLTRWLPSLGIHETWFILNKMSCKYRKKEYKLTPDVLNCALVYGGGWFLRKLVTAASWYDGRLNTLLKPPPEKMTCSHAPSGSKTVEFGFTWVAPTEVTKGQTPGKSGLKRVPLKDCVPVEAGVMNILFCSTTNWALYIWFGTRSLGYF